MKITSSGIVDGVIQDRFGKRGTEFNRFGMATRSLPVQIEDAPAGTASFALILEDKDSIPVCGYAWIHWMVANLRRSRLTENESTAADFVQGATSWSGGIRKADRMETSRYGGMAPPDAPHVYELHVYALDALLNIAPGFYMNDLWKAMEGHILAQETLKGVYSN